MRFAFTEDQIALRDATHDLLAKECPPKAVRAQWEDKEPGPSSAWRALAEMGVLGVLAPESLGGLGLSELDLVLVLEETGYFALPEPIVEHAAVAVPLLNDLTTALTGTEIISATAPNSDLAPGATLAHSFVVGDENGLALVERGQVEIGLCESVDQTRSLGRIKWDSKSGQRLDDPSGKGQARGLVGISSQLVGLTRRMLDMTVEYVIERQQFGVPVGSFQAVKHHLADARIALEFARPLVYRAAWSLATDDPDYEVHASMAKAMASDAALLAGRKALQCHGAIGYSFEYDLHLFMKRAWALASTWGDARAHRSRLAQVIL